MNISSEKLSEIKLQLDRVNHKVIVICMGEANYPNASIRKLKLLNSGEALFAEDGIGRTAALLRKSPVALILIQQEGIGFKLKGEVSFCEEGSIHHEECRKLTEANKSYNNLLAVKFEIKDCYPL